MELSLTECKWQVKGYWPYVPIKETSMELGQELKGTTNWIDATVPGGVHYDLYRAGYIEEPYFGTNSLKCEWIESRWWVYRTTFEGDQLSGEVDIEFEGLDYEVMIYLNDHLLGEHKGMFEKVIYRITPFLQEKNQLVLVFKGVPEEMGQIGYTSKTSTQKSRFNYKWDFSTRLVNIGIWKDVKLRMRKPVEMKEPYIYTNANSEDNINSEGKVHIEGILVDEQNLPVSYGEVHLELKDPKGNVCGQEKVTTDKEGNFAECLRVKNPELWFPNGYGEQPLYHVSVFFNDTLIYEQPVGIRTIKLQHNATESAEALPYTFVVNNKRIYIKGVNITPLDHLYGNVTKEQYQHLVEVCVNANINLIRVWGGGLIEKEWLYEYCDTYGILIWQEFIQSSSGIDNKPCEDTEFLQLLEKNAIGALLGKRNFTSLAVWSGGNELTEEGNIPCGYDNPNLALLKSLVETYDRTKFFFPTSASGPREFVSLEKGVSHDVHGGWRYEGNPAHYEKYGTSDHLFHSEFGSDSTPCFKSMKKFLGKADWYPTPMSENLTWQHHGEWWGTYYRDQEMFGNLQDFSEFIHISQYMQVESLRFMVEADRRRKYQSSGSIIWQLNEPWPNASCTNLMDYYGECKPAYYWVAKAFAPIHVSLDYRTLLITNKETTEFLVYVHNSTSERNVTVMGEGLDSYGTVLYEKVWNCNVPADSATFIGKMEHGEFDTVLFLRLRVYEEGIQTAENVYAFGAEAPILSGLRGLQAKVVLAAEHIEQIDHDTYCYHTTLINQGSQVAVHAGVELEQDEYWMWGKENYVFLFPGEEKHLEFTLKKKTCGGFLEAYHWKEDSELPRGKVVMV